MKKNTRRDHYRHLEYGSALARVYASKAILVAHAQKTP